MKKTVLLLSLLVLSISSNAQIGVKLYTEKINYVYEAEFITLEFVRTEKDSILIAFSAYDTLKHHTCEVGTPIRVPASALAILSEYPIDLAKINVILANYGIKAVAIKE